MYAILFHGGKQYKVKKGQIIKLEKINSPVKTKIKLTNILMIVSKKKFFLGKPFLKNSKIKVEILEHKKDKKINIIKYKRRKHYKKIQGHRQNFTYVKIDKIIIN